MSPAPSPHSGSRIPLVIDGLVAAAEAALPRLLISDGPVPLKEPERFVIVGVDELTGDADWIGASASQDWSQWGARRRSEDGEVNGVVVVYSGSLAGRAKPARDDAFGIFQAIEAACRAAPTLGVPGVWKTGIAATRLRQIGHPKGVTVQLSFTLRFWAHITAS